MVDLQPSGGPEAGPMPSSTACATLVAAMKSGAKNVEVRILGLLCIVQCKAGAHEMRLCSQKVDVCQTAMQTRKKAESEQDRDEQEEKRLGMRVL